MADVKSPAFQLYTGDFLSSPDVQMMDTREVGAYCLLLFNAWQGSSRGHLPNDEGKLRRLAKMTPDQWAESREILLGKFPVAEGGATRYNPRLVLEAEKQDEYRRKQAGNGAKGGRPKKNPTESQNNPPLSEANPSLSIENPEGNPKKALQFSSSTTSNEVGRTHEEGLPAEPSPLPAKEEKKPATNSAPPRAEVSDDDQAADESPLAKPTAFQAILKGLYPTIDYDYYREKMLVKAPVSKMPARSWRNWIVEFMERELKDARKEGKELLTPAMAPAPNEVPTNTPAAVPIGVARISEPELNTAFVGQQQANRQAASMARLQTFAQSVTKTI